MWVDLTSVHVILDDAVVKTVLSKLTTTDLERLTRRGTRPGRTSPATDAVDPSATSTRPRAIEIDRTANRDGIVIVCGHELAIGVPAAGARITLRIDGELMTPNRATPSTQKRPDHGRRSTTPGQPRTRRDDRDRRRRRSPSPRPRRNQRTIPSCPHIYQAGKKLQCP